MHLASPYVFSLLLCLISGPYHAKDTSPLKQSRVLTCVRRESLGALSFSEVCLPKAKQPNAERERLGRTIIMSDLEQALV